MRPPLLHTWISALSDIFRVTSCLRARGLLAGPSCRAFRYMEADGRVFLLYAVYLASAGRIMIIFARLLPYWCCRGVSGRQSAQQAGQHRLRSALSGLADAARSPGAGFQELRLSGCRPGCSLRRRMRVRSCREGAERSGGSRPASTPRCSGPPPPWRGSIRRQREWGLPHQEAVTAARVARWAKARPKSAPTRGPDSPSAGVSRTGRCGHRRRQWNPLVCPLRGAGTPAARPAQAAATYSGGRCPRSSPCRQERTRLVPSTSSRRCP
mmetsp:Transcript_25028/g.63109  ORF Transcript_25028/g.63109 Transcript_25028/m.63109 type:complete len:268 (-) Transcript_25028:2271-3074(-)